MTERFPFGVPFQRSLLRLCMIDESFNHRVMQWVDPGYFTTESLGWIFRGMKDYYDRYSLRCTDIPMQEMTKWLDAEKIVKYGPEVQRVIEIGHVTEDAYIKNELKDFIQRNKYTRMHREAAKIYNDGKIDESYDLTQRTMDEIRQIDFDAIDRSWFFEDFQKRQARRIRESLDPTAGVYTTGIPLLDASLDGGLRLGEVFLILAYAKIGKTTWLVNQGFVGVRVNRVPTLHINLEGNLQSIEDRYETRWANEMFSKVSRGDLDAATYRDLVSEYNTLRKLLVIRSITDWSVNILAIDAELNELKAQGFVPEKIIIDYLGLMRSRDKVESKTDHMIDATRDAKTLANRGYAVWSGAQAQRPRKNADEIEHIVKSGDIATAYEAIRIVDGYGSLNQTNAERDRHELRLHWEDCRRAEAHVYLKLYGERGKMKISTRSETYIPPVYTSDDD